MKMSECAIGACIGMTILICFALSIFIITFASIDVDQATEWKKEMTKESCYIIDRTQEECTYDCNCSTDDEGHESCSTCYGLEYEYDALVFDKCGNQTISTLVESNCNSAGPAYNIEREYTCYVLDCDDPGFIFEHPDEHLAGSIVMVVVGCICVFCPCIGLVWVNSNSGW